MELKNLLEFTPSGIYCEKGDFYIDPLKPVKRALITHAHSDHARYGSESYLSHNQSLPILKYRLGKGIQIQGVEYNEKIIENGVTISFHPAGHIPGASQIRVEYKDEVWVASGDYKIQEDGISTKFEPVKCDVFITESTFALPVFKWKPQIEIINEINNWWRKNKEQGKASIIFGYSLGKSQRVLANVDKSIGNIYVHGTIFNTNEALIEAGFDIPNIPKFTKEIDKNDYKGALIVAPPSAAESPWVKKFYPYSTGYCSGWMAIRGNRRRRAIDRGFVLSDHADWNDLNEAIRTTEAKTVYVTHGYTSQFVKYLKENGINAKEVNYYQNEEEID